MNTCVYLWLQWIPVFTYDYNEYLCLPSLQWIPVCLPMHTCNAYYILGIIYLLTIHLYLPTVCLIAYPWYIPNIFYYVYSAYLCIAYRYVYTLHACIYCAYIHLTYTRVNVSESSMTQQVLLWCVATTFFCLGLTPVHWVTYGMHTHTRTHTHTHTHTYTHTHTHTHIAQ